MDYSKKNTMFFHASIASFSGTGDRNVLNQVYVPIVSTSQCNQRYWYHGQITNEMVCAGREQGGRDSCQVSELI